MLVIIARLIQIQIIEHKIYDTRSTNNRIETHPIAPPRGLIYDRNGVLIAENTQVQSLAIIPERVENLEELLRELKIRVAISDAQVEGFRKRVWHRRRPYDPVTLKDVLTDQEQAMLAVDRYKLPGVVVAARDGAKLSLWTYDSPRDWKCQAYHGQRSSHCQRSQV